MIRARGLVKRYGETVAVNDLTFDVCPGQVTGFLGPNGAGKSTTMRLILGLDAPTRGSVTVNGRAYRELHRPLHEVGALLEVKGIHPGRSAYNHLRALAQSNDIDRSRVDEVLEIVGLSSVARKRAGGFSLGMGQRLGIAAALLGNPPVLLLDEPVNGLDPEGIIWIRNLLRNLAAEGRTIFLSSHLMSEMSMTAQHLVVIGRGRLIADLSLDEFIARSSGNVVRVRSPQLEEVRELLLARATRIDRTEDGALLVGGLDCPTIADAAFEARLKLYELVAETASLEDAYLELTQDTVDFHAQAEGAPLVTASAPRANN